MHRLNSTESPLEAAAGAAGPRATEAFSVLGNETRLAILLALWEAYEPFEAENTVAFAELRKRVGMRDGSQFNYHLTQLVGHFVRHTDDGYELRRAGHKLVQSVIAGAGLDNPELDPTEVDRACPVCGAPTVVTYHDEWLFHVCTECEGRFGNRDQFPEGTLAGVNLNPAVVTDRKPEELLNAAFVRGTWNLQSAVEGVCAECSGPMEGWLHVCDDHGAEGVCPNCDRRYEVMARFRCPVCKASGEYVPSCSWLVMHHPAVIAFYADHGVPLQYDDDSGSFQPRYRDVDPKEDIDFELITTDPPRVRVTFQHEGAELELTLDENVNVIDVSERGRPGVNRLGT
ncbi:winged helix-turn-helix domain-containing protein [Halomicrococcus sp. SG-WS-1]|uniref:winged helix-turn-helix domain-containing protein n=1 Tax=Halomicrococcus sp. SG-WS-1 TaxID=3439057 RepID=UPI003F7B223F